MKLKKVAASTAIAGGFAFGALGFGAGLAQADPYDPVPPPVPICPGGPGVNCDGAGTPLPPGQRGAPPPGHYNDPVSYGLPAVWMPPNSVVAYPIVWNPEVSAWGVYVPGGPFVPYAT
ncbi:hypothetical protein MSIMFB_02927 [Mycobacterium simulans]|uniref:Uncharacterized protein n=1 Tax=Mycobacterium simulans TaxID=627089 RepID=A0A7Z7IKV8_9MYCO|nr:hypothetical protein [Mycobacterium simulans]SOJ55441.1 hypothetical protein MSIMFB_02927 [Mycobacterium simulans]SON63036.1 hypothetical protein MSIMFI_04566 [Mycobacterium simulans]